MTTLGSPQPPAVPEHLRFESDTPEEAMQFRAVDMLHCANCVSPLVAMLDSSAGTVKLED